MNIGWRIEDGKFRLTWRESGGPLVAEPERKSFGTTLIKSMFATQLKGAASMRFEPDGLVCVLEAPLDALTQEN